MRMGVSVEAVSEKWTYFSVFGTLGYLMLGGVADNLLTGMTNDRMPSERRLGRIVRLSLPPG